VLQKKLLKAGRKALKIRDAVNKRRKNEGTDNPSLKGCIILGKKIPRDVELGYNSHAAAHF
jgi:hypothetical protein